MQDSNLRPPACHEGGRAVGVVSVIAVYDKHGLALTCCATNLCYLREEAPHVTCWG
jgi:hypothetical protein